MIQKLIKVGTSRAITLPKKVLQEFGFRDGEKFIVTPDKTKRRFVVEPLTTADAELFRWTKKFIGKYRSALEALANK